jgi:uncharacterized repeat protein (TIGR02543 family)
MRYFYVEPEVAGGFGENTVTDHSVQPFVVTYLHYVFDGWLGDVLLTSHPCFIVTEEAAKKLLEIRATGIRFGHVEVTTSGEFEDFHPGRRLPRFVWLQVDGRPGKDDFGIATNHTLVMSERAIDVLRRLQLTDALIKPFRDHH